MVVFFPAIESCGGMRNVNRSGWYPLTSQLVVGIVYVELGKKFYANKKTKKPAKLSTKYRLDNPKLMTDVQIYP